MSNLKLVIADVLATFQAGKVKLTHADSFQTFVFDMPAHETAETVQSAARCILSKIYTTHVLSGSFGDYAVEYEDFCNDSGIEFKDTVCIDLYHAAIQNERDLQRVFACDNAALNKIAGALNCAILSLKNVISIDEKASIVKII